MFGTGEGAIFPVIALSARELGASSATASLVVALVTIGSLLANLPAAALASRYGERRAMVGAALFSLVALAICLAATQLWVFGLGVFMVGLSAAVFMLARQTFIIEAVPIHLRARAISTLGGTMRIGMFIGPFVAAGFIQLMGLAGAYWAAVIAMVAAGAISLLVPDLPTSGRATGIPDPRPAFIGLMRTHARVFLTLGLATALVSAVRACRQIVIPLWADNIGLDATAAALIYGLMGAVDMSLFYPAGRVMDLRGRVWVALPSMVILSLSFIAMPFTSGFASLLVVSLIMGVGNGIGSGIIMTIGADASPRQGRTPFLGIWRLVTDCGGSTGPIVLSGVTAALSLAAGVSVIGGIGLVSAYMFWHWLPHYRRQPTTPETTVTESAAAPAPTGPNPPAPPRARSESNNPARPD